ncbi:MAG: phosphoglucomutase/phosphomannomutase family protein [Candidatus Omnitrophota bacterium]
MTKIKFGTSGWRAVISDEFTFENVRIVTQAIAGHLKGKKKKEKGKSLVVVVGYDTRFLSKEFAQESAKVLSDNGITVLLSERDVPTPVVAFQIIKNKAAGGINFTASHNPPQYNGIKFSPETGGPAPVEITKEIEENIAVIQKKDLRQYKGDKRFIKTFNPRPAYLKRIESLVDFEVIKKRKLKLAIDCLYGTSREYLDALLSKHGIKPIVLHDYLNPSFDGKRPEPAPENITELIGVVKSNRLHLGLATDGDADRFGIVDSDGTYITPNEVITLLLYHLLTARKKRGNVVARTLATTHMIDLVAKKHGIEVLETPVGFKYFVDAILSGKCIIAGEESGGLSMSGHVPEKDGILACLLIAEMVAVNKKPIKDILAHIYKEYGRVYADRINISLSEDKKRTLMNAFKQKSMVNFAGRKIVKRDLRDGCKLYLEDGSWALFRPSGTEPIVRSYYEASSGKVLKELLVAAKEILV